MQKKKVQRNFLYFENKKLKFKEFNNLNVKLKRKNIESKKMRKLILQLLEME